VADRFSRFEITSSGLTPQGAVSLQFPVKAGYRYRVERSTDLQHWEPAAPEFTAAQSGTREFTGDAPASPGQFFRVAAAGFQ